MLRYDETGLQVTLPKYEELTKNLWPVLDSKFPDLGAIIT